MGESLQYRRTHKAIIQAFISIAKKKPFQDITVQDILEEALVSRYTFYKHFKDKYEIAELLQAQLLQEFRTVMQRYRTESAFPEPIRKKQLNAYNQLIFEHHEVFSVLRNIHTDTVDLENMFRQEFYDRYLDWELTQTDRSNRELEALLYASIMATVMTYFADSHNVEMIKLREELQESLLNVFLQVIRVEKRDEAKTALRPFIR